MLEGNRIWTLGTLGTHGLSAVFLLPVVDVAIACSGSQQ